MQKQFKKILARKDLLIRNSKDYCYDISNSLELCKLNLVKGCNLFFFPLIR